MASVRDIMRSEVIAVRPDTTVQELVRTLDQHEISGVPVLDDDDELRGVVSRTDVVRMAARDREIPVAQAFWETVAADEDDDDPGAYFVSPESPVAFVSGPGAFDSLALEDTTVDQIMTPVAFTVEPEMSVADLARFLVQGRIHRALVVDSGRLVGIVTAFDVLRSVAAAAEE